MKTAKEKAEAWVRQNVAESGHEDMIKKLEILLREQDRDTRHACAEAVFQCNELSEGSVLKNEAYRACMNVEAV